MLNLSHVQSTLRVFSICGVLAICGITRSGGLPKGKCDRCRCDVVPESKRCDLALNGFVNAIGDEAYHHEIVPRGCGEVG